MPPTPGRERENGAHGLTNLIVFKALNLITGHGTPLTERPSSYRHRRHASLLSRAQFQASPTIRPASNWPGADATHDFSHLPPRGHSLTPAPPPAAAGDGPSDPFEQNQCAMFKLPPELLLPIFEEVIGKRVLHIVRRNGKLGHATCKVQVPHSQEDCKEKWCRGLKLPIGIYVKSGPGHSDLLPLLQSCRRIYALAIDILYSSNLFDFDSMETFISFSTAILPVRFDSIQQLQLEFRFSMSFYFSESTAYNDPPRWERTWRVVGSMRSLQKLWVWVSWHRLDFSPVEEARLLEQLEQVRQLKTFEVSLPSLKGKEAKKTWEQLFSVQRRN